MGHMKASLFELGLIIVAAIAAAVGAVAGFVIAVDAVAELTVTELARVPLFPGLETVLARLRHGSVVPFELSKEPFTQRHAQFGEWSGTIVSCLHPKARTTQYSGGFDHRSKAAIAWSPKDALA